jgi:hypothetical protein
LKISKLMEICRYIETIQKDQDDCEFEIVVDCFGEMFILDYYKDLDILKIFDYIWSYHFNCNSYLVYSWKYWWYGCKLLICW